MPRWLLLVVLIGALWAVDAFVFRGFCRDAILNEMNYGAQIINNAAQNILGKLNR